MYGYILTDQKLYNKGEDKKKKKKLQQKEIFIISKKSINKSKIKSTPKKK